MNHEDLRQQEWTIHFRLYTCIESWEAFDLFESLKDKHLWE